MFDGFKLPDGFKLNIDLDKIPIRHGPVINTSKNKILEGLNNRQLEQEEEKERIISHDKEQIELLRDIKASLKGIDDIVLLLSKSVNQQEETLELLKEIFSIGASPDEETANSRFRKVKNKITELVEDYETSKTLADLAKTIYVMTVGII